MIHIFGGSYAQLELGMDSWVTKLSNNYDVCNYAKSNSSNPKIFLSFKEQENNIKAGDVVIMSWNDYFFPYINDVNSVPLKIKNKIMKTYIQYFFNNELTKYHYEYYLNHVKEAVSNKSAKLIVVWAFPSNYMGAENFPYNYNHSDYKNFTYSVNFENEIRPALVYFSHTEIMHLTESERIQIHNNDPRPNHIGNLKLHDTIYTKLTQLISGELSGVVDLILERDEGIEPST